MPGGQLLKKAEKKLKFLLSFHLMRWCMASNTGCASNRHRPTFKDRLDLHHRIEDEKSVGNCSGTGIRQASGFASENDIDRRAEIFIANFRHQLLFERQVSLENRLGRRLGFEGDEENWSF